MKKIPMTVEGEQDLKRELEQLKKVERPQIIQAIAEARGHGDLSENAEYHSARHKQSFIEGRIHDIEAKLAHSQVIDVRLLQGQERVVFGATVAIVNIDTNESLNYKIVGDDEADIKVGKISVSSPIARALIGKQIDDVVDVNTPSGVISYEITDIEFV